MRGEKIFETVPEWTIRVAPLKEPLVIPHYNYEVLGSFEDECISPQLAAKKKKNPSLATAYSFHSKRHVVTSLF